eukprot:jgi/Psemu1/14865/gm1.14865_g
MNTSNLQHDAFHSFDQPLATIMQELFDVSKESDSILCDALKNSTIQLHLFLTFGDHLKDQAKDPADHNLYTKEVFEDYSYSVLASVPDSTVNPKSSDQLRYEYWMRISRDATTFPVLNNDAQFEHWLVKFKAKLDANGINTTTFLDPDWPDTVLTGYPKALHDKQCAFFWTLLRHVFQGDFSSSCVLNHQWTRDGRQAYFDFVKFHHPVSYPAPVPVTPPLPDDLKSLFPSFDSELAYILHTTLNAIQEAHSHLCEALISANIKSWDEFVAHLASPDEVAYLEYRGQEGWQPISLDDQQTLNTFIDLVFLVNSQDNGEWYDISQYNRTVFLYLYNTRAWSPGLAAIQNRANLRIPLSLAPWESADVRNITSTPVSPPSPPATVPPPEPVLVRPPAIGNPMTPPATPVPPPTPVHSTIDTPETHIGLPGNSHYDPNAVSPSTGSPSYTWSHIPLAFELPIRLQPTLDGNFTLSLKPWYFAMLVLPPSLLAFLLCNFHHLGHLLKIVLFQAPLGSLFMGHPFVQLRSFFTGPEFGRAFKEKVLFDVQIRLNNDR